MDNGVITPAHLEAWLEFRRRGGVSRFELWSIRGGQAICVDRAEAAYRDAGARWAARASEESGLCVFAYDAEEDAPCAGAILRASKRRPFSGTSKIDPSVVGSSPGGAGPKRGSEGS